MTDSQTLASLVQKQLDEFLASRSSILSQLGEDVSGFASFSREFLSGGKRFRAQFCYWGWRSIAEQSASATIEALLPVVRAASALEIFHAAALIHDDIIDNSDTRRGAPSTHRSFEQQHRISGWDGDATGYGRASAILLGDLLLGWSDEMLDDGLELIDDRTVARAVRADFVRMRTEVTAGQYLDILEEQAWRSHSDAAQLARARNVIVYKSAKYSIEAPLLIGAAIGGASGEQRRALSAFGLPLGIAYQLRDDMLGVFGDASVTGKPSGDDLREGKRTVLIGLTRQKLPTNQRRILDEMIGDPELSMEQIAALQATIRASGAADAVEELIARNVAAATSALNGAPLENGAVNRLRELAGHVTRRVA